MRYSGLTGACLNCMSFNNFIKKATEGIPFLERFREYSEETNFSNGEVVQRGTGANYGVDGFLRPGFSYTDIVGYLHSKIIEYKESGQSVDKVLSHDWSVKIAASLVPRGLETHPTYCTSLRLHYRKAVFEKFISEMRYDPQIPAVDMETALRGLRDATDMESATDSFWSTVLSSEVGDVLNNTHVSVASCLSRICDQVIDFAASAHQKNIRISSELVNQPKSVDSIVDDFAVEAQNFANSLTMSAALAASALALRLVDVAASDIVAAVLGGINILVSFGTMANASRYKIRNEEARIHFWKEKFENVKKSAFIMMRQEDRATVSQRLNPFVSCLEQDVATFRQDLRYYDFDEPIEFNSYFAALLQNLNDPSQVRAFQMKLITGFIADKYHVNSYIQESLVKVVKSLDQMYECLVGLPVQSNEAMEKDSRTLFYRLVNFGPRLKSSLQDGPVRWGFIKKRKFLHWDICVAIKYLYSLIWCSRPAGNLCPIAPIQVETLGIAKLVHKVSVQTRDGFGRREAQDTEHMYWASRESDIASLIFLTGFAVFMASVLFTIARIFDIDILERIAFWAVAPSALGAALATFHLVRKLLILQHLWIVLGNRHVGINGAERRLKTIRGVMAVQLLLPLMRLLAAALASIALPFALAEKGFDDRIGMPSNLPFILALVSIMMAVGATVFFFVVEYVVRYNLPVDLGPFVCKLFNDEIRGMYEGFCHRMSGFESRETAEKEIWEYTAREFLHKYRFDTVFAADRFGTILQYLQSGMDGKKENAADVVEMTMIDQSDLTVISAVMV